MRIWAILAVILGVIGLSGPAFADWELELDGSGSTVAVLQINSSQRAVHYFIAAAGVADSSWLFISDGYSVDICTDDDVTTETTGVNNFSVNILVSPETLPSATPSKNLSRVLLGMSLTGVASTSGTTNDCDYQVWGPQWLLVDFTGGVTNNGSLVSVIARRTPKS